LCCFDFLRVQRSKEKAEENERERIRLFQLIKSAVLTGKKKAEMRMMRWKIFVFSCCSFCEFVGPLLFFQVCFISVLMMRETYG